MFWPIKALITLLSDHIARKKGRELDVFGGIS
jgi:hypothetical protein